MQDRISFLDSCDPLEVKWVDEENIPFFGWVDSPVKIEQDKKMEEINVSFPVKTLKLNDTNLSFNTPKYLVQNRKDIESIVSLLQTLFR